MNFHVSFYTGALAVPLGMVAASALVLYVKPFRHVEHVFAAIFAVLLTPAWIVATVAAAPMPLGGLLWMAIDGGFVADLWELLGLFWWWYLFAFPTTYIVGKLLGRSLLHLRRRG